MRKMCSGLVLGGMILIGIPSMSLAQEENPEEPVHDAIQVAEAWFDAMVGGETAVALALSSVPFSFDGKNEVSTLEELRVLYDQVFSSKGARDIRPDEVRLELSSRGQAEVVLRIEDEEVRVLLRPDEAYRVSGFRD